MILCRKVEEEGVIGGRRRGSKEQRLMPCASAQIAWLQRLLMRFLIRDLYRLDFGNITELIKMIGMEREGERELPVVGQERACVIIVRIRAPLSACE